MRLKINGKWVELQDGAEIETEAKDDAQEGDEEIDRAAKSVAASIAKALGVKLGAEDRSGVDPRVAKFLEQNFPTDSKLAKILNGKDVYSDELTKEEKIVGFYHALCTSNDIALKALAEGTDADGGYLFPSEFFGEIVRDLPEINVMRQWVRIIPMKRDKMDVTSLVDGVDVFWTAENAAKSTTTARFAQQELKAFKMAAILYSSDELIEDSTEFDVVQMIVGLFSEAVGEEEEKVIWTGDGTTQPQGINTATVSSFVASGTAYNDIVRLFRLLPRKYRANAAWFMNDSTATNVELVKDTTGRPLFMEATGELPATLKGKPIVISDWVPDRVIYFGDLKKGYFLGDRKRMTAKVSQDTETAFTKDQTAIRVVARIGGRLVLPAAVRKVTSF